MPEESPTRADTRAAIVTAAARLLREDGPTALTTRGVAEKAGVQAPTIYRIFGDKDGLLEAVAEHVMADFVAAKTTAAEAATASDVDPEEDVRSSWHQQIDFGLANPAIFRLLSDPDRVLDSPAAQAGKKVLEARVHRLAQAGRLRIPEQRAVDLIQAAGIGTIQALLATPLPQRDPHLAATMLDAVLGRILCDAPIPAANALITTAVALRAQADQFDALSASEQHLLTEWLDRIAAAPARPLEETGSH